MEFYDHGNEPERDLGNDEICGPVSAHCEVVAGLDLPTRNLTGRSIQSESAAVTKCGAGQTRMSGIRKLSQNKGSLHAPVG